MIRGVILKHLPKGYEQWANRQRDREMATEATRTAGLPKLHGTPQVVAERLELIRGLGVNHIFSNFGFPGLAHVPFDYSWGGALSMARNGEPVFGRLADGIHGALVHNGTGLSRGAICGKLIAEMVCGEGSDLLDGMLATGRPNRNLPDPLLGWGVNLYARRLRMRSGREM